MIFRYSAPKDNIWAERTIVVGAHLAGRVVADTAEHRCRNYLAPHRLELIAEVVQADPVEEGMRGVCLSLPGYVEVRVLVSGSKEFVKN